MRDGSKQQKKLIINENTEINICIHMYTFKMPPIPRWYGREASNQIVSMDSQVCAWAYNVKKR